MKISILSSNPTLQGINTQVLYSHFKYSRSICTTNDGEIPVDLLNHTISGEAADIQNDEAAVTDDTPIIVTYKDICNVNNLELGLQRTKSGKSAGLDGEIKATFTTGKREKLAEELKSHKFKASPIRKV
jgi:hypothetical protein